MYIQIKALLKVTKANRQEWITGTDMMGQVQT